MPKIKNPNNDSLITKYVQLKKQNEILELKIKEYEEININAIKEKNTNMEKTIKIIIEENDTLKDKMFSSKKESDEIIINLEKKIKEMKAELIKLKKQPDVVSENDKNLEEFVILTLEDKLIAQNDKSNNSPFISDLVKDKEKKNNDNSRKLHTEKIDENDWELVSKNHELII